MRFSRSARLDAAQWCRVPSPADLCNSLFYHIVHLSIDKRHFVLYIVLIIERMFIVFNFRFLISRFRFFFMPDFRPLSQAKTALIPSVSRTKAVRSAIFFIPAYFSMACLSSFSGFRFPVFFYSTHSAMKTLVSLRLLVTPRLLANMSCLPS
jgi:hypothetical protein